MFSQIAIAGFGLIGGSVALAVREVWPSCRITAIDRPAVVDSAMRLNAADAGGDDVALADGAELIVLAAPVRQNINVLRELATRVGGGALVTDVGSTKRAMVEAANHLVQTWRDRPGRLDFIRLVQPVSRRAIGAGGLPLFASQ